VFFQTIRKLDSTRAIFTYTGGASNTTVRIAAHNGTSAITLGTAVNATSTSYYQASPYGGQKVDTVAIDANKFVIFLCWIFTSRNSIYYTLLHWAHVRLFWHLMEIT
jgi:hypothetical protein